MNEILESLYRRKSVRVYEDRPVDTEMKRAILEAACQAPSAGCQQLYTILDITDQSLKNALAKTCDDQPFIATAPVVLVFCADCRKWYDAYVEAGMNPRNPGPGDMLLAVTDTAIAAQNAVVAAESFGLGSCYIGDILEQYEAHRNLLHLPEWVMPAVMLVIGWPTQQQLEREKPQRAPMDCIVHENGYRHMDGKELRAMFDGRTGQKDFDSWMQMFCARKYEVDFSREMSRSVGKYLEDLEKKIVHT